MKHILVRIAALSLALTAAPLAGAAAPTPTPAPRPLPTPNFPNKALHVQLQVEVNKKGQVVRVVHGDLSGNKSFDTMALGNAMQMWIRHPDGSAEVGLYRVTYDYDPHTRNVTRTPSIIKPGGNWGDKPGAANLIMKDALRQAELMQKRLKADQAARQKEEAKHLPDINAAIKRGMASPTPHP